MNGFAKRRHAEPLSFLLIAASLMAASSARAVGAASAFGETATVVGLRQWAFLGGMLFVVLAAGSYVLARMRARSLSDEVAAPFVTAWDYVTQAPARLLGGAARLRPSPWLLVAIMVGTALRVYFALTQPLRYDEAFTFLYFVNGDLSQLFFIPCPTTMCFICVAICRRAIPGCR
jgi:hypothetical protein